jgi:hypothetical protein
MEIENNQMMNGEDETYAIPTQRKDAPLDQAIVGSSQVRKQFLNLLEEDERDTINSQHGISDIDDNRDVSSEDEPESMSNVPVLSDQNEGYTEIAPAQYQERELLASEEQLQKAFEAKFNFNSIDSIDSIDSTESHENEDASTLEFEFSDDEEEEESSPPPSSEQRTSPIHELKNLLSKYTDTKSASNPETRDAEESLGTIEAALDFEIDSPRLPSSNLLNFLPSDEASDSSFLHVIQEGDDEETTLTVKSEKKQAIADQDDAHDAIESEEEPEENMFAPAGPTRSDNVPTQIHSSTVDYEHEGAITLNFLTDSFSEDLICFSSNDSPLLSEDTSEEIVEDFDEVEEDPGEGIELFLAEPMPCQQSLRHHQLNDSLQELEVVPDVNEATTDEDEVMQGNGEDENPFLESDAVSESAKESPFHDDSKKDRHVAFELHENLSSVEDFLAETVDTLENSFADSANEDLSNEFEHQKIPTQSRSNEAEEDAVSLKTASSPVEENDNVSYACDEAQSVSSESPADNINEDLNNEFEHLEILTQSRSNEAEEDVVSLKTASSPVEEKDNVSYASDEAQRVSSESPADNLKKDWDNEFEHLEIPTQSRSKEAEEDAVSLKRASSPVKILIDHKEDDTAQDPSAEENNDASSCTRDEAQSMSSQRPNQEVAEVIYAETDIEDDKDHAEECSPRTITENRNYAEQEDLVSNDSFVSEDFTSVDLNSIALAAGQVDVTAINTTKEETTSTPAIASEILLAKKPSVAMVKSASSKNLSRIRDLLFGGLRGKRRANVTTNRDVNIRGTANVPNMHEDFLPTTDNQKEEEFTANEKSVKNVSLEFDSNVFVSDTPNPTSPPYQKLAEPASDIELTEDNGYAISIDEASAPVANVGDKLFNNTKEASSSAGDDKIYSPFEDEVWDEMDPDEREEAADRDVQASEKSENFAEEIDTNERAASTHSFSYDDSIFDTEVEENEKIVESDIEGEEESEVHAEPSSGSHEAVEVEESEKVVETIIDGKVESEERAGFSGILDHSFSDADEEADSDSVTGSNTGERLTFASERNGGNEVHAKRSNSYDDSIVGKLSNENEEVEEEHGLEGNTREEHAYLNGNDLQTGAHSLESALSNILDKSSMKEPLEEEEAHLSENDSFGGPQVERPLLRSSSSISSTSSGFLSYSSPHRTSANASNNDHDFKNFEHRVEIEMMPDFPQMLPNFSPRQRPSYSPRNTGQRLYVQGIQHERKKALEKKRFHEERQGTRKLNLATRGRAASTPRPSAGYNGTSVYARLYSIAKQKEAIQKNPLNNISTRALTPSSRSWKGGRQGKPAYERLYNLAKTKKVAQDKERSVSNSRSTSRARTLSRPKGRMSANERLYNLAKKKREIEETRLRLRKLELSKQNEPKPLVFASRKSYTPQRDRSESRGNIHSHLYGLAKINKDAALEREEKKKAEESQSVFTTKKASSKETRVNSSRLYNLSYKKQQEGQERRQRIEVKNKKTYGGPSGKIPLHKATGIYERGMMKKMELELKREDEGQNPYVSPLLNPLIAEYDDEEYSDPESGSNFRDRSVSANRSRAGSITRSRAGSITRSRAGSITRSRGSSVSHSRASFSGSRSRSQTPLNDTRSHPQSHGQNIFRRSPGTPLRPRSQSRGGVGMSKPVALLAPNMRDSSRIRARSRMRDSTPTTFSFRSSSPSATQVPIRNINLQVKTHNQTPQRVSRQKSARALLRKMESDAGFFGKVQEALAMKEKEDEFEMMPNDALLPPQAPRGKLVLSSVPDSSGMKHSSDVSNSTPSTAIETSSSESSAGAHETAPASTAPYSPSIGYRYLVRPRSAEYRD